MKSLAHLPVEQREDAKKVLHKRLVEYEVEMKKELQQFIPIEQNILRETEELQPLRAKLLASNRKIRDAIMLLNSIGDDSVKNVSYVQLVDRIMNQ